MLTGWHALLFIVLKKHKIIYQHLISVVYNKMALVSFYVEYKDPFIQHGCSWSNHDDVIKRKHFPRLLAICAGNSLASGEFPAQRPVTRSFDVFFLCLNKRLRKQSWGWWFETLSRLLWRHCNISLDIRAAPKGWIDIWNESCLKFVKCSGSLE